jgi:serine/threonine protein kinase
MSRPLNSPNESPDSIGAGNARQDTILLSEAPEAPRTAEAPSASSPVSSIASAAPDFNASRLEALTQRYDILGEAGHGNMGDVYKARDRETGEIVALKLVKPEIASDSATMDRFKNELLFARKITHKNVCRVYDFNRIGGIAYTSMEFVEGESLRSVLNRFGGFPIRKGVNVALQICSGLKEAHAQGIVHRDLKPENVMIDAQGNVKIMDFGIARSMEAATRLTGSMVGTPAYMAPEQVSGKPVDFRTDIYSLGLVLYEMFTGTQAVQADTPVAVALKQIRETPAHPHDVEPTIPVPIERAILKCLEKEPAKRFQSVGELEKILATPGITGSSPGLAPFIAAPTPVVAPVPSTPVAQKSRRTSPFVWIIFGAGLVLAGLAAGHLVQIVKTANQIPPPPALPAPKPPESALTIPAEETTVAPKPNPPTAAHVAPAKTEVATASKPEAKSASVEQPPMSPSPALPKNAPAKVVSAEVFPPRVLPGRKSSRQIELNTAPSDVQQRADKAFGETKSSGKASMTYLWVGRYQREDKAEESVQKLKGLSLPAYSLPRHGPFGEFWVVVTGPFPAGRVSDVTQWLEAQGYRNVHRVGPQGGKQAPQAKPE